MCNQSEFTSSAKDNCIIDRVKALKGKRNSPTYVSNAALANEIGYSDKTIKAWLAGKTPFPVEALLKICDLFQCDIGYLTGEIDTPRHVTADICKATGLSEESIQKIRLWKDDKRFMNGLEHLITSQYASNILYAISDNLSQCYSEKDYQKFKNEHRTPQLEIAYENAQNDGLSGIASPYNMLLEMEVTPKTLAEYTLQKYITLLIHDKTKNNKGGNENELQP